MVTKNSIFDRRRFLELGLRGGITLIIGSAIQTFAAEAEAKERPVSHQVLFRYETIVGNTLEDDNYLEAIPEEYKRFPNHAEEDGLIRVVKPLKITMTMNVKEKDIENRIYRRVTGDFDFRRYTVRKDQGLSLLARTITDGYPTLEEKAQALLCFVQTAISYDQEKAALVERSEDWFTADYIRRPKKTLLDQKGDCKDTSVLYASLLAQLAIPSVYLHYDRHFNIGVPLDFEHNRIRVAPASLPLEANIEYQHRLYFVAETAAEQPLFIGKILPKDRGRKPDNIQVAI